ncbi:rod shape-determining protein MreC [Curvivirga sp.]|uniref:rod shape-determining protein MreC n=1 Tax=Curvivirga sp. TaxID=2856848 RepID=UPI003B598B2D
MRAKQGSVPRIAEIRALMHRFAFLLLLMGAIAVMVLGRAEPKFFENARDIVTDFSAPVLDLISRPTATIDRWVQDVHDLIALREENVRLKAENQRLLQWLTLAKQLQHENKELQNLLSFKRDDISRFITGRVIGSGNDFYHTLMLNVGLDDGVRKGQAAVNNKGLVGRVYATGRNSSRILLVNDINSRIPVRIEETRVRAVLAGENDKSPRLIYTSADSGFEVGQRVITSGHGGAFAPGIPVGTVSSVTEGGVLVDLYVDPENAEYLRLMDFGLNGILPDTE